MEKMIEKAEEELEILENEHPNRFNYLKIELKSFISLLRSQQLPPPLPSALPTTSSASTQASTSTKRKRASLKRKKDEVDKRWKNEVKNNKKMMGDNEHKDRVDVVLEKAQACLRKIQDFKFSLFDYDHY